MVTGIKLLLGVAAAAAAHWEGASRPGRNSECCGWRLGKCITQRRQERDGVLYRAPPKQGETPKLLSPRLQVIPPGSTDVTQYLPLLAGMG